MEMHKKTSHSSSRWGQELFFSKLPSRDWGLVVGRKTNRIHLKFENNMKKKGEYTYTYYACYVRRFFSGGKTRVIFYLLYFVPGNKISGSTYVFRRLLTLLILFIDCINLSTTSNKCTGNWEEKKEKRTNLKTRHKNKLKLDIFK
jgi:hypothetical protein